MTEASRTIENSFFHLPRTEQAVAELPLMLQQMFEPHLAFIGNTHKYLGETVPKSLAINGSNYMVKRYRREETGDVFSFYTENEAERKTIELRTDVSHRRIEYLEVSSWYMDGGGNVARKVWTVIDLGRLKRGVSIQQQVNSIPARNTDFNHRQIFILTTAPLSAQLSWMIGEKKQGIVTISSEEEVAHCETRWDFKSGLRSVVTPLGNFYLPPADDFLAMAIIQAANLRPVQLVPILR